MDRMKIQYVTPEATEMNDKMTMTRVIAMNGSKQVTDWAGVLGWDSKQFRGIPAADGVRLPQQSATWAEILVAAGNIWFSFADQHGDHAYSGYTLIPSALFEQLQNEMRAAVEPILQAHNMTF